MFFGSRRLGLVVLALAGGVVWLTLLRHPQGISPPEALNGNQSGIAHVSQSAPITSLVAHTPTSSGALNEKNEREKQIAGAACQNPVLQVFAQSEARCQAEALDLRASLEARIRDFSQGGEELDLKTCVVKSPNGQVSTINSLNQDFLNISQAIIKSGFRFDFDQQMERAHFARVRLVALCSVVRSVE